MKEQFRILEEPATQRIELSDTGDEYDKRKRHSDKTFAGPEWRCFSMVHDDFGDDMRGTGWATQKNDVDEAVARAHALNACLDGEEKGREAYNDEEFEEGHMEK